jgi:hypothetical protein
VSPKPAGGTKAAVRKKPAAQMQSAADVARSVIKRLERPKRAGRAPGRNQLEPSTEVEDGGVNGAPADPPATGNLAGGASTEGAPAVLK